MLSLVVVATVLPRHILESDRPALEAGIGSTVVAAIPVEVIVNLAGNKTCRRSCRS